MSESQGFTCPLRSNAWDTALSIIMCMVGGLVLQTQETTQLVTLRRILEGDPAVDYVHHSGDRVTQGCKYYASQTTYPLCPTPTTAD